MSANLGSSMDSANERLIKRKKRCLLPIVIMGAGRLGESLLNLSSFPVAGFTIVGVFDKDPKRIGVRIVSCTSGTHVVEPTARLASRVHSLKVKRGIIAVPPATAQEAADELIQAGINVILSYAPADVTVPSNVIFTRVDPATQFVRMLPPPGRFPWRLRPFAQDSTAVAPPQVAKVTSCVGLARLPSMWTSLGYGGVAINPVLLTLVSPGPVVEEESDFERDEEASTVTSASISEDDSPEALGFFEFIQSNQKFFVANQRSSPIGGKSSLVGLEEQVELIKESLTLTDELVRTRGTLLYGPSGCGKSTLIKHLAATFPKVTFFHVHGDEESLLAAFAAASGVATSPVVVIENIDVVCRKRAFKSTFLSCTDNPAFNSVAILATSNSPWDIDMCVLRHFERRMFIPLPDASLRAEVLRRHFSGCTIADRLLMMDFVHVARDLDGYSTSDVITVAKTAGLRALKTGEDLSKTELVYSASLVRPTFCREMLPLFISFTQRFGTRTGILGIDKRSLVERPQPAYMSMYS